MLRVGWFATGRGETSPKLLRAAVEAIRDGRLDAEISFVFSNREAGQYPITDRFFEQVRGYGLPLVTLSDANFRKERGGEIARAGKPLPAWRTEYDTEVARKLEPFDYDIGMLAGYMLIMTPHLFTSHPMLNLHPAAPGQPEGTWQDVIWKLIDARAERGGVRLHLATDGLDEGPIVTYCTYPLRGPTIDLLWRQADGRTSTDLRESEGEGFPLFQEIRRRGVMREPSIIIETLRAVADERLRIEDDVIRAGDVRIVQGYDLTPEIEAALSDVMSV
jgi:folate-dependent phosphoribosylglycinamide formyltransferase PurN